MLFQRINRKSPEQIFAAVVIEAGTVVEGDCMKWSSTGSVAYPLGFAVVKVAAATDMLGAGVIWNSGKTDTINIDDVALLQIYGVHPNVKVTGALASAGIVMTPSATAGTMASGVPADDPSQRLGNSLGAVSGGRAAIFLRCM
jgi:hypothetical protein